MFFIKNDYIKIQTIQNFYKFYFFHDILPY